MTPDHIVRACNEALAAAGMSNRYWVKDQDGCLLLVECKEYTFRKETIIAAVERLTGGKIELEGK